MSPAAAPRRRRPSAPDLGSDEHPRWSVPRGSRLSVRRVAVGCLLLVALSSVATMLVIWGEIGTLASDLSANKSLVISPGALAPARVGDPQTILLIGNDQRNHTTTAPVLPHSNEMLLLRIDPSKPWISMMSIPRELEVTFDGANGPVTTRLNAALIYGGMSLLLKTIKQLTGLSISHVVMVDFNQFKTAVSEIGCVYGTVDERYYHVNTLGSEQYQEIDLQPGYQRLCGTQALQFVSYRHDDSSLVRDARDQDFLLDVKQQYAPSLGSPLHVLGNLAEVDKLGRVVGQAVQVDHGLQTDGGIENLLGTLVAFGGLHVRQVQFQVNLQPTGANPCSCDTATPQQIAASVHSFLDGADTQPTQRTGTTDQAVSQPSAAAALPLAPSPSTALAQAQANARQLPFPLEYPQVQDASGSGTPVDLRDYPIHAPDGPAYPAYVAVFSAGQLGQYYDVQGTTWTGSPMLQDPSQTVTVAGRSYSLYYTGAHLTVVAWSRHGAVYWVHNTLTDALANGELLAIAEQTRPTATLGTPGSPAGAGTASLKDAVVPTRSSATSTSLLAATVSTGGLLILICAPLLAVAVLFYTPLRRRLELPEPRRDRSEPRLGPVTHDRPIARRSGATAHGTRTRRPAAGPSPPTYARYKASILSAHVPKRLALPTPNVICGGVAAVVAAGVLVGVTGAFDHANSTPASRHGAPAAAQAIPTVPVAVLNATTTQGAAAALAQQLSSRGVKITAVGNVNDPRPPSLWILYAGGDRTQATRLAKLLAARSPRLAPIDPAAQAAAGPAAALTVEIT